MADFGLGQSAFGASFQGFLPLSKQSNLSSRPEPDF
jgi:hypothetical protein